MNNNAREWLDSEIASAQTDRDKWQTGCVEKWAAHKVHPFRGSIEAATGAGKSRIGIHAIRMMRRNGEDRKVIVVVPTRVLKSQWEKELRRWRIHKNTEVWVVNSVIKGKHDCFLLIWDEIHRAAANTFVKSFDQIRYSAVLGLTATMNRLDGRHDLLLRKAPVIERLTTAQARARGWIANFKEYWVGLELGQEEQAYYDELESGFQKNFAVFAGDWKDAQNSVYDANLRRRIAAGIPGYTDDNVYHCAVNVMRYMQKIRKFIIEHPAKRSAALKIIKELDRKTLTFGESIEVAESLAGWIGQKAMAYHSESKPIFKEMLEDKPYDYKTEAGARKFAEENEGWEYKFKHGKHKVQRRVMKKIAGESLKEYILHKVINTKQVNVICTAKALNEGFDFPGAELGIVLSRSKSPTTYTQQTGRVCRIGGDYQKAMVHIYLKNTRDYKWLKEAGQKAIGYRKVDGVEELLDKLTARSEIIV